MFDFLKRKELAKIAELERRLALYQEENNQLREENKKIPDLELKLKIMELYVDDDEVIDEILTFKKLKESHDAKDRYMQEMAARQSNIYGGNNFLMGLGGLGNAQMSNMFEEEKWQRDERHWRMPHAMDSLIFYFK